MSHNFASINTEYIPEWINYPVIKDYILSDGLRKNNVIPLYNPTVIEGIVFVLCINGTSTLKLNSRTYYVRKNMLLTILPDSVCQTIEYSNDTIIEYLFFSVDFIYGLNVPSDLYMWEKAIRLPLIQLTDEKFKSLLDFHTFMAKQYRRGEYLYKEHLAKNLLASFLLEVYNIYNELDTLEAESSKRKNEYYQQFKRLLLNHIKQERTVQFYADKLCISAKYLSQLIKEVSGKSAMDWINHLIIIKIKILLKTSTLSIIQISEELNFSNSSYLGRYFRKHTGMTPLQYRES